MFLILGIIGATSGIIGYFMGWKFVVQLLLVAGIAYLVSGRRYRWFYVAIFTAKRDFK